MKISDPLFAISSIQKSINKEVVLIKGNSPRKQMIWKQEVGVLVYEKILLKIMIVIEKASIHHAK